jgi:hypothetical protein
MADDSLVIDGIEFESVVPAEESLEHRLYAADQISKSGLRSLAVYKDIPDPSQAGYAMLGDIYHSGHAFTFLSAMVRRKGQRWTVENAKANADILKTATGPAADQLASMLSKEIVALFVNGSVSARTSPTSSSSPTTGSGAPLSTSAPPASTTGNGTSASAASVGMTPRDIKRSQRGRSGKRSSPTASVSSPTPVSTTG